MPSFLGSSAWECQGDIMCKKPSSKGKKVSFIDWYIYYRVKLWLIYRSKWGVCVPWEGLI
jgi:hypothetical protein